MVGADLKSSVDQLRAELKNAHVALELNSVCSRLIAAESTDVELEALESGCEFHASQMPGIGSLSCESVHGDEGTVESI